MLTALRRRALPWPAFVAFVALLALLTMSACSSAAAPATLDSNPSNGAGSVTGPDAGPASAGPSAAPAAAASGSTSGDGTGGLQLSALDRPLVVETGTLQLQVADVNRAIVRARTAVVGLGGFESGSQESLSGDRPVASITYRIPAARWDDALTALRGLAGKVISQQTQAVEVTGQVLDLGARIDNLQASERALQAIMARATKISDVLDVQNQLSDVQGQIEQLTTQRAHLQDQAAYGTLTVGFEEPVAIVAQAAQGWDPAMQVDRAVAQLVELGQGIATAGIWLAIVGLPFLVLLGLAIGLLLLLFRRLPVRSRRPPATDAEAG